MAFLRYILMVSVVLSVFSVAEARPKVGLVLGGGGAAGVAHVGVLKVLEEHNIPVDMIAGTSMGAIVGGLYASGLSAAELEKTVNSLDWISLFADDQSRSDQGFHQKRAGSGFFRNFELGIRKGKLKTPSGLVTRQKLMFELRKLFAPVGHIHNFDRLPIPFRAVATDIETGEPVVLRKGNLAQSVRASMAIPGMFSPVSINNKILVDGFVSNNVPVSIARQMGADILIVVNIPTFLEKKDKLDSAVTVSLQAMQLMMLKTTQPELAKMTSRDVLVEPGTKDIGNLDFDRVAETIPLGEKAARTVLAKLKALNPKGVKLAQKQQTQKNHIGHGKQINRINIKNDSVLKDAILKRELGLKVGDRFDAAKLQRGLENIHGLEYFDLVDHTIKQDQQGGVVLSINARKKSGGNQRLRFGISIADDLDGNSRYQMGAKHTLLGVNNRGAEWSNSLIIGDTIRFDSAFYQPIPEQDAFFDTRFWNEQRDFFFYQGEERVAEVRGRAVGLQLDVGRELDAWGESRAGLFYRYIEPDIKTGQGAVPNFNRRIKSTGLVLQHTSDTTDDDLLPSEGHRFSVEYTHGFKALGSDQDFDRLWIKASRVFQQDKHRFIFNGEIGSTFADNVLPSEQLTLGGMGRQSGLAENQLLGNHMVSTALIYMYELYDSPGLAQFYVGGTLEAGNAWERLDDVDADDVLFSASVFLGADTPLGPAFIGVAQTESYNMQPFLYLGQSF
ncbi:MAG: patatin-like phospholipase family protein [Thiolinea sp.]